MAHYALLDENNIVVSVITGRNEGELGIDWEEYYKNYLGAYKCLRTSYNTSGNKHRNGGVPFRGNYAGTGFKYDPEKDVFIPPQPYPSWILNQNTFMWEPPVPAPAVWDPNNPAIWDEEVKNWVPSIK